MLWVEVIFFNLYKIRILFEKAENILLKKLISKTITPDISLH